MSFGKFPDALSGKKLPCALPGNRYLEFNYPMKKAFLLLGLLPLSLWARPIVLVSYFDAFQKAPFNSSEKVAFALKSALRNSSKVQIELCGLETKFDTSYAQLENCMRNLPERPAMVVALGETGCNLKIELAAHNLDNTLGPDNAGVERKNQVIIPEASDHVGLTYPLPKMYCALSQGERRNVIVSTNAGAFVCNNTAFQFAHYYHEMPSGFIHVPAHNCRNVNVLLNLATSRLATMIEAGASEGLTSQSLPFTKSELAIARKANKDNACYSEFYGRAKGIDEKKWKIF
jgi:pyrrolidone-carboxylate peptidase